ncbi:hypothetical protein LXA43DRAFT_709926 [Ganoderma leucocontextum]|nr:hypothetical protein LXA43DRAFT_709926 [Ganoderma leucocontextum]
MRLLNTKTGEFALFGDPRQVRYAILSHVWSVDGTEQTYERTCEILAETPGPAGTTPLSRYSEKIQRFCEVALKDGFEWGWVDSSCIDKTSSSELSEAINSMYDWYRYSGTCYSFLHDLHDIDTSDPTFCEEFGSSKWFTRGWTLQELLAPSVLLFLSSTWRVIGSKYTLASVVEAVTDIDNSVLTFEQPLEAVCVARKMSWAASRTTTRVEDEAYSLMGIFGVTISISYGEGRYAFIRLQEEIVKHYPDQTIFAWGHILPPFDFTFAPPGHVDEISNSLAVPPSLNEYFLASGPRHFRESSTFRCLSRGAFAELLGLSPEDTYQVFTPTSYGMHAYVPLLAVHRDDPHFNLPTHLALLACEDQHNGLLALLLRPQHHISGYDFHVGAVVGHTNTLVSSDTLLQSHYYRVTYVTHDQVISLRQDIKMVDLYIPHRPPITSQKLELEETTHAALRDSREFFEVRLSGWSQTLLAQYGYTLTPTTDANVARHDGRLVLTPSSAPTTSAVVISNSDEHITIRIGRCNCALADQYHLLAVMVSARGRFSSLSEKQFQSQHYEKDHPAHVQSWQFRGGFASNEVQLESIMRPMITLRLTFSHETQHSTGVPRPKVYRLGVEILAPLPSESPLSASPAPWSPMEPLPIQSKPSLSYSQVAASPPIASQTVIANPVPRVPLSSAWPPRLPAQASGLRSWTLNSASQPSAIPQRAPRRETSQLVPIAQSHSAQGRSNATDSLTRRPSPFVPPPPPVQSTRSAPSTYSYGPRRPSSLSQYGTPSEGTGHSSRQGSLSQTRHPTPSSRSSMSTSVLSLSTSRASSRRTSTRAPSPISERGERMDLGAQGAATAGRRDRPLTGHRQSTLQGSTGRGQQRPARHTAQYTINVVQGRARGNGSSPWEVVNEDT